jgi:HPt (histidine-containing phosphotransfer) domain-containing protein
VLGLRHVAGNVDLYLQLLERFRESQRQVAADIRADLEAGRFDEGSKRAHTLRGVAGNIGARDLQLVAQAVEEGMDAPTPDVARLAQRIDTLDGVARAILAGIDAYFAASSGERPARARAPVPDSGPPARTALAHLLGLLAEFSGDATDYFDSVHARLATLIEPGTLERVGGHLARYEFEEARQLLAAAAPATSVDTP